MLLWIWLHKKWRDKYVTHYLYVIPFKDGLHFKFGYTANLKRRINQHGRVYSIDKQKAFYIKGEERVIKELERKIKAKVSRCSIPKQYKNKNGYTEIRRIKKMQQVKRIMNNYFLIEKYKK